jgi:2-hydroxy-3-oxopropionate reductase
MTIGFIGLGIMGAPMATNLIKAGHSLVVFDIVEANVSKLTARGAKAAPSCRAVAEQAALIITMLPNSPHVRKALLGPEGVAEGARKGAIIADMSSIAPLASREMSVELAARGIIYLDAPVSGGEPKAVDGSLAIMVGGPVESFDSIKSILGTMGSSVTHVGDVGSGNVAKLANQMIVAQNIAAVSEAMVLATKAGVDPERVYQAIRGGLAGSTVLEQKMGKILDGNFQPGFRIELHIKDLLNVMETATSVGVPVPQTAQVLEILKGLQVSGHGKEDHCALVQYFETLAGTKVRRRA